MILALRILIAATIVLFAFGIMLLLRESAYTLYNEAKYKCKQCKKYTGCDNSIRIIYCNNSAILPEEALECKGGIR